MKPRLLRYRGTILGLLSLPLFFCLVCQAPAVMAMGGMENPKTCSAAHSDSHTTPEKPILDRSQTQTLAFSKAAPGDLKPIYLPFEVLSYDTAWYRTGSRSAFLAGLAALQRSHQQDLYLLNRSLLL